MDRCGASEVYMIGPTNNRSSIGRIALEVNDGFPTQRPYDLCSKRMVLSTSQRRGRNPSRTAPPAGAGGACFPSPRFCFMRPRRLESQSIPHDRLAPPKGSFRPLLPSTPEL